MISLRLLQITTAILAMYSNTHKNNSLTHIAALTHAETMLLAVCSQGYHSWPMLNVALACLLCNDSSDNLRGGTCTLCIGLLLHYSHREHQIACTAADNLSSTLTLYQP